MTGRGLGPLLAWTYPHQGGDNRGCREAPIHLPASGGPGPGTRRAAPPASWSSSTRAWTVAAGIASPVGAGLQLLTLVVWLPRNWCCRPAAVECRLRLLLRSRTTPMLFLQRQWRRPPASCGRPRRPVSAAARCSLAGVSALSSPLQLPLLHSPRPMRLPLHGIWLPSHRQRQ